MGEATADFSFFETDLTVTFCPGGGTSGTTDYSIARILITDGSDKLPAEIQNKTLTFDAANFDSSGISYQVNHHNACDTLVLDLPHATYGLTAFSGFGADWEACGRPVTLGAPQRTRDLPNTTLFQIQYPDSELQKGHRLDCRHALLACSNP